MAENPTVLKIRAEVENLQGLNRLKTAVRRVSQEVKASNVDFKKQIANIKELQVNTKNSVNNLRAQKDAFMALRDSVDLTSKEFKQATIEVNKLDKALAKTEVRKTRRGGRGAALAKGVGAIAAGGVFGGFEGAAGAAIGLGVGGPAGAAIGAAIGAQVGGVRQALGATAEYAAELSKLRIALKGVTADQAEYSQALAFVEKTTDDFAIPQEIITRQFTKLQASVSGAGGNLKDTETAFNGIVAAVRATGGSLTDVDAALTATAQVFSKGKVSAEELRQQIGERLPGAFTLFADSMDKTPAELDKALEQGQVSLQDFQKFAEELFGRYGETAKTIADSPDAAGDRLKVVLERLSENMGTLLKPIGAAFQVTFTNIIEFIDAATARLNLFLELGAQGTRNKVQRLSEDITRMLAKQEERRRIERRFGPGVIRESDIRETDVLLEQKRQQLQAAQATLRDLTGFGAAADVKKSGLPGVDDPSGESDLKTKVKTTSAEILALEQKRFAALRNNNREIAADFERQIGLREVLEAFNAGEIDDNTRILEILKVEEKFRKAILKLRKEAKQGEPELKEVKKEAESVEEQFKKIGKTIKGAVVDNLTQAIMGARSLGEALGNVLRQAGSLFISFGLKQIFPFLNANGNVYDQSGFVPFAKGGVVNKPTLFPFAKGIGLMGEAGPEAIMPLRRGPSGRLGVEAAGGGVGNVVVNVDASGSAVQGDSNQADQLGKAIGAAVQAELLKQKRPGGMLAGV
nr:phage-related minor tail protein [uncultured Mediterranean phage uvMED]